MRTMHHNIMLFLSKYYYFKHKHTKGEKSIKALNESIKAWKYISRREIIYVPNV